MGNKGAVIHTPSFLQPRLLTKESTASRHKLIPEPEHGGNDKVVPDLDQEVPDKDEVVVHIGRVGNVAQVVAEEAEHDECEDDEQYDLNEAPFPLHILYLNTNIFHLYTHGTCKDYRYVL